VGKWDLYRGLCANLPRNKKHRDLIAKQESLLRGSPGRTRTPGASSRLGFGWLGSWVDCGTERVEREDHSGVLTGDRDGRR
jgi:hypothetical protein